MSPEPPFIQLPAPPNMEVGIRIRKVVARKEHPGILGCLKNELAGRCVSELLDELRGPVELQNPAPSPC